MALYQVNAYTHVAAGTIGVLPYFFFIFAKLMPAGAAPQLKGEYSTIAPLEIFIVCFFSLLFGNTYRSCRVST